MFATLGRKLVLSPVLRICNLDLLILWRKKDLIIVVVELTAKWTSLKKAVRLAGRIPKR